MVERRIVRLKATQEEMERYNPPLGISLMFLEWFHDKGEVIVEFVGSPLQPDPVFRKSMNDIRYELVNTWRHRLLQDNMGTHPLSPKRAMTLETIVNHPFVTGRDVKQHYERLKDFVPAGVDLSPREIRKAAEEGIDRHEVVMTPQQAEEQLRLSSTDQKLNIEPIEVRQERRLEQVFTKGSDNPTYKEVYGPELNVYEFVVIDSG